MDARLAAWDRLHDALGRLPGWAASRPQRHPLDGSWTATAVDSRHRGRGATHEGLTAAGATEAAACRGGAAGTGPPRNAPPSRAS